MNKCIDCGKKLTHASVRRCISCFYKHNRGKNHPSWTGGYPKCIDCGKELSNRYAERCIHCNSKYLSGKHHPGWIGGYSECIDCGKKTSSNHTLRCQSCYVKFNQGKNHPTWKERPKCLDCGKILNGNPTQRCRKCYTKYSVEENNPNYKGGKPKCSDCGKDLSRRDAKRCSACNMRILFKTMIHKKNKQENNLEKILRQILPKEYKYVGDGKVWIEGFNPDFINCNGRKKIIELFGDYWHNLPKVFDRDHKKLKIYKKYGYDCLVIWEKDLKSKNLENRILSFHKSKICH